MANDAKASKDVHPRTKPNVQQESRSKPKVETKPAALESEDDIPKMIKEIQSFLEERSKSNIAFVAHDPDLSVPGTSEPESDLNAVIEGCNGNEEKAKERSNEVMSRWLKEREDYLMYWLSYGGNGGGKKN